MARASMERQVNGAMKDKSIFRDEEGSTTAGMAVALLVTLSLLFSAAQVYRIHAAGAEVQEVADAAACAALNPVAEFMVAVRVADAAVLSLTLLGDIAYGAGVVALCVPPAAELGSQLVSAGQKVIKARDAFSQKACEGLEALQRALPFLAAANGAAVAAANGEGSGYAAMALLLPLLFVSPEYLWSQYAAWAADIVQKNGENMFCAYTNISLVGCVRKISGSPAYSDLLIIVPAMVLFLLSYLRTGQYKHFSYRLTMLASLLLFIVLFSSGSEHSGYVIAALGMGIWWVNFPPPRTRPARMDAAPTGPVRQFLL